MSNQVFMKLKREIKEKKFYQDTKSIINGNYL